MKATMFIGVDLYKRVDLYETINYYTHRASKVFSKGVHTLVDWSVPSLGRISTSVQLSEVAQDFDTLSTFVSSGVSVLWMFSIPAVHCNSIIVSMVTCR